MYRMIKANNTLHLLNINKNVFTTADLGTLWSISNSNTLWTTIKRYVKSGALHRVHKGVYSKVPLSKLDKYELACVVMGAFSYVSLESVLVKEGIIFQGINMITVIGQKNKKFNINGTEYVCKSMKMPSLLNRMGINDNSLYSVASKERAAADLGYYKPKYYLDNDNSLNLEFLKQIKEEVFENASR